MVREMPIRQPEEREGTRGGQEEKEGLLVRAELGGETVQKIFEQLFRGLKEIGETGRTLREMLKGLPSNERNDYKARIAGLETEVAELGKKFGEEIEKNTALQARVVGLQEQIGKLEEEIARLKGEAPAGAFEEGAEAEIEKPKDGEKEERPIEVAIEPELVRQIREEILREIQENNERRKELLKEKRVLGQEFTKLYEEISRFVQADPMARVLYSKWFKRLMKGKEKEGEEFYQQGEALPQMQEFNFRETELKKRWEEIHQELDGLDLRRRDLRDVLARIFSENLENIRIKIKPSEKPEEGNELAEEERDEILRGRLEGFEAQQNLANLFLERVQEQPLTPEIPSQEIIIETSEADIIPSDEEEVTPPPLPLKAEQEIEKQKREKGGQVRKLLEDLKGRDQKRIISAFDILYQKINGNPDYQEILTSQLSRELETFDPKRFKGEAYLQNLILLAGETKDKSLWPLLFAYLSREDISQTSKFFVTRSLYRINRERFLVEAEDIYETGGKGAAEAILEITDDDKKLESKGRKEGWLPPALPRVRSGERDEEGIIWSGRSRKDIEEEDKERRLNEEGIEFPEETA